MEHRSEPKVPNTSPVGQRGRSAAAILSMRTLLTMPSEFPTPAHLSMRPIPDAPHLSPQFKRSQPVNIRQANLGLGPPVHARGIGNRRKPQAPHQGSGSGVGTGPIQQHHPLMALQQAPQQALRQLWTLGQQRSVPPTAALQASTNTRSRVSPVVTQAGAGAIRAAPANSAGPDPDPPAPGAPAGPPPQPLPLPAR
jgi:hypothetical protein